MIVIRLDVLLLSKLYGICYATLTCNELNIMSTIYKSIEKVIKSYKCHFPVSWSHSMKKQLVAKVLIVPFKERQMNTVLVLEVFIS